MEDNLIYTVPQLAKKLGSNCEYIHKLRKSGLLKFMKLGNWKVSAVAVNDFLSKYEGWDLTDPYNPVDIYAKNQLIMK